MMAMQPRDFNRDWALRLAEVGMAIFPCGPDKKPLVKWREFSSNDATAVAQWWSQYPNALPAIDLKKCDLVVLDGDRHGGPDGRAALRALLQKQPDYNAVATPRVLTPGDGAHVYFQQNGHELTNARGNLPDGIDVRGAGGYVIAPYAVLPDGRRYQTAPKAPDLISAYKAGTIPPIPEGIVALLEARKTDKARAESATESPQPKPGVRERSYAETALEGCTQELAACVHPTPHCFSPAFRARAVRRTLPAACYVIGGCASRNRNHGGGAALPWTQVPRAAGWPPIQCLAYEMGTSQSHMSWTEARSPSKA
jgi:hypothetical protein